MTLTMKTHLVTEGGGENLTFKAEAFKTEFFGDYEANIGDTEGGFPAFRGEN